MLSNLKWLWLLHRSIKAKAQLYETIFKKKLQVSRFWEYQYNINQKFYGLLRMSFLKKNVYFYLGYVRYV